MSVAVDVPLMKPFTYRAPKHLTERLLIGQLVHVPWRRQSKVAVILDADAALPPGLTPEMIKPVEDILDRTPVLSEQMLRLMTFIARYYRAPIGEVVSMAVPAGLRRSGQRMFVLTEAGSESLESFQFLAPRVIDQALELLFAAPEQRLSGQELRKRVRGITYDELDRAVEDGRLETFYELERPGISAKFMKWLSLAREPEEGERLGAVQCQIVDALLGGGPLDMETLKMRVPRAGASLRSLEKRGLITIEQRESYRDPLNETPREHASAHVLTKTQQASLDAIIDGALPGEDGGYRAFLLHGVTGSGKTQVYLSAIRYLRERGLSALVLLPEIALTPQFCGIFRAHFGDDVAVLHSGLSHGERYDAWRRLRRGEVGIAIGARSALFAPMPKLGIIIVDEEHDSSFKQGESPRYNARDMALVLGSIAKCRVVLGSATPSLETFQLARDRRLHYLRMAQRVSGRPLPAVRLIDMTDNSFLLPAGQDEGSQIERRALSLPLLEAMTKTLARKEQVIILLNRRGFSPFVQCGTCGHALYCRHCSVSLTYHQQTRALHCHYCDHTRPLPQVCPKCESPSMGLLGLGTQRLSELLAQRFPEHRVDRLDRDAGSGRRQRALLRSFKEGAIDILVGTQMVAKGHDIHNVTLVGVVMADLSLNFPDFRSAERTFQLVTQVAGRAGRGELKGQVLIQTLTPDHYALQAAKFHSYEAFLSEEIVLREELHYPPFSSLVSARFEAIEAALAEDCAERFAQLARVVIFSEGGPEDVNVLGPALAPLGKIRGRTRFQLLLKARSRRSLRQVVEYCLDELQAELQKDFRSVRLTIDVDPLSML